MSNAEIYRVNVSPWARARTGGLILWAFATGFLLAKATAPAPIDARDWSRSVGHIKGTLYDPNTGITEIREQSSETETLTNPDPAAYDLFHSAADHE